MGQQKVQNRLRIDYCSSDVVALAAMQGDVTAPVADALQRNSTGKTRHDRSHQY